LAIGGLNKPDYWGQIICCRVGNPTVGPVAASGNTASAFNKVKKDIDNFDGAEQ